MDHDNKSTIYILCFLDDNDKYLGINMIGYRNGSFIHGTIFSRISRKK